MTNNSSGSNGQQERDAFREKQDRMDHFARQFNDDSEGLRLHHELCNPAVAEAASQCRVVWAQVKGYPYWPAQILLPKDAKIRFRDTAQEYSEKRMATHRPVHFFVTREISWVLSKQVKSWEQGVADGCHTKNRMNGTFRDSLVQVCDLLYGRKAPSGFSKPTQPANRQRSAPSPVRPARQTPASPTGAASAPQTLSPQQGRSAPRGRTHSSAEHFAEEVERSRNAILGGISRDERHRRREESRATEAATQPSPSDTLSPPAYSSGGASGGRGQGTPGSSAVAQERDSGGDNAPKRHTRSQGLAELGMSDLRNLEPRKIPRRGGPCVPNVSTSGMGSRGTGDGATGRPPPVETPKSVGTAPFADARPHSVSASLPGDLGTRCPVGSPRSSQQQGEVPRRGMLVPDGGPPRQAQSAGPVLSTPGPDTSPCAVEFPSQRQWPSHDTAGMDDSGRNGTDSSVVQQSVADAPTVSVAIAATASMHQPPMELSVGPEPKASPVVCQEGRYINGPSPRAVKPVQAHRQPSPAEVKPPEVNITSVIMYDVPAGAAAATATSEPEKHVSTSQAVAPVTDDFAAPAGHKSSCDVTLLQGGGNAAVPRAVSPLPLPVMQTTSAHDMHLKQAADYSQSVAAPLSADNNRCEVVVQGQEPLRNGSMAVTPRVSLEVGVSAATQDEEMRDVGGSVNGEEDEMEQNDAEMTVKRPRRAVRSRKNAQELVNGEAARGVRAAAKVAERGGGARSADGGSRNTSCQRASGPALAATPARRKSASAAAGGPQEAQAARRTRSANGPTSGGTMASQAEVAGELPMSHQSQLRMSAMLTAAAAASQGATGCSTQLTPHAVLEQIAVLRAQPKTEENLQYVNQLQAMLQSLRAQAVVDAAGVLRSTQAVSAAGAPLAAAQVQATPPRPANMLSVKEAIKGMFSRGCDITDMKDFWLPHEYMLMRTSQHHHSDVNKYPPELKPKRLRKDVQICSCTRREEFRHSDTFCCGAGCLNRSASILCDPRSCPCRGDCQNKPFNLRKHPNVEVMLTDSRGKGLFTREQVLKGQFVVEYTGEVVNETERLARMVKARNSGVLHFYIMELSPGLYIDAAHVGSNARFMNSSCDPNCETQKWKDAATGETRIGLFTTRAVQADEELTYDYHFQHAGLQNAAQGFRCMCGSVNCRGTMDENPERMRDAGRRVRIKWDDDDKWYEGYVLRYHPNTRKHTIYYPVDGDAAGTQETLLLDAVEHEWMDDAVTAQLPVIPTSNVAPAPTVQTPPKVPAINPATGLPPGKAAVDATHERERREKAKAAAAAQQAHTSAATCAQTIVSAPSTAMPAASAAAQVAMVPADTAGGTLRVPLPRPLPMRPPERGTAPERVSAMPATPADGLELLSSVAASLPDRSHTPALGSTGAAQSTDKAKAGDAAASSAAAGRPVSDSDAAADDANLLQMPMFAVLALLQPRITDTSQLQRAPLPAADHAAPAPAGPAHDLKQQQQHVMQSLLSSSVVQQQALAAMAAAGTPAADRVAQPVQQPAQQPVTPQSGAIGFNPSGVATGVPAAQQAVPPLSQQADAPTPSPQAMHAMRTISPSPASQAPQVLTQAAYPNNGQPHNAAAHGVPFPAISQYQALQNMQASMHVQAAQIQVQQHHHNQQPATQVQTPQQSQQQSPQTPQSTAPAHAQQSVAQAQAVQQAQMQLLAAANWPQHMPQTLAASMQAMLQQVVAGMQRGDGSAVAPMQTALSVQQQQQMLRLAASLPVQLPASQPAAGQPALRSVAAHVPAASPVAAPVGGQHQHAPAAAPRSPGISAAVQLQHPAAAATGACESTRPAQPQTSPIAAAAQAAATTLLSTPPRSPGAIARTAQDSPVRSLAQTSPAAENGHHGSLKGSDHAGPFPTSPAAATAAAAVAMAPVEPYAVSTSAQGTPASVSDQLAATVQMLTASSEKRSSGHGGASAAQGSEAAPHPMRFAEQLQRSAGDSRGASSVTFAHGAGSAHEGPTGLAPMVTAAPPAAQVRGGRVSAFMVSGASSPALSAQTNADRNLHAGSTAAAPVATAAPHVLHQSTGTAAVAGNTTTGDGSDASAHGHWLLALNVNEDMIRTWYSYARDHLKIADPLHEAHRGDFMKFMSDLQKQVAYHQYMAQARSQSQHATPAAAAPVLGQMVAHAAPQIPWPSAAAGTQPQAPAPHVAHWGFRPH